MIKSIQSVPYFALAAAYTMECFHFNLAQVTALMAIAYFAIAFIYVEHAIDEMAKGD